MLLFTRQRSKRRSIRKLYQPGNGFTYRQEPLQRVLVRIATNDLLSANSGHLGVVEMRQHEFDPVRGGRGGILHSEHDKGSPGQADTQIAGFSVIEFFGRQIVNSYRIPSEQFQSTIGGT